MQSLGGHVVKIAHVLFPHLLVLKWGAVRSLMADCYLYAAESDSTRDQQKAGQKSKAQCERLLSIHLSITMQAVKVKVKKIPWHI